jgi:hypothetical protein
MARGWESKSVEAQQDDAARGKPLRRPRTDAERAQDERRLALTLTRTRAAADLARARSPHHRRMLEQAIAALDEQLAQLTS